METAIDGWTYRLMGDGTLDTVVEATCPRGHVQELRYGSEYAEPLRDPATGAMTTHGFRELIEAEAEPCPECEELTLWDVDGKTVERGRPVMTWRRAQTLLLRRSTKGEEWVECAAEPGAVAHVYGPFVIHGPANLDTGAFLPGSRRAGWYVTHCPTGAGCPPQDRLADARAWVEAAVAHDPGAWDFEDAHDKAALARAYRCVQAARDVVARGGGRTQR